MVRRHHREEEGDLSGRDVGLIGERQEKVSGYESPMWECVDKMVKGDYPTTNLATVAAGSKHAEGHPHKHSYNHGGHVSGSKPSKVHGHHPHHRREEEIRESDHRETGAAMKKGGDAHKKHHHSHKKHHFAAGGVGKERKGMY